MIAVIFEAQAKPGQQQAYLDAAAVLRPLLKDIDGFVSIERFESVTRPGHYLSLSIWRDEAAVRAWRCQAQHRSAQQEGRGAVFASYRLRVATIVRDYGLDERDEAPADSRAALL